ncbi:Streptomycin 3''-adenylyltransferase [Legionella busanensis]|uniref:Aminoglycoside (3'') (9) adenylyltransferase n=1 Tax=Legionella busanensis TaxID=190655 RepID=A0A378JPB7_9GAMM|nr:aminoglycoside adenylyltransferase family protein [Legionella busanensis]STX49972.1 Streptomycin 3''-adenylyltransferase [Legionella busanensis]
MTLDNLAVEQVKQCTAALKSILKDRLLGVYLYGSAIIGGLQKYSDLDLFVVASHSTTSQDKAKLITEFLKISGIYLKSIKRSIEITIVVKSAIKPWRYPPLFDFQYGEWLRNEFESGNHVPWLTNKMPDLALIITQVLLASNTLFGPNPTQLLPCIPYSDVIKASLEGLGVLIADLNHDTRNVLLTLARIWCTVSTDTIRSKTDAATWAIEHLPKTYQLVMQRARAICLGHEKEYWTDIQSLVNSCANIMVSNIKQHTSLLAVDNSKSIKVIK